MKQSNQPQPYRPTQEEIAEQVAKLKKKYLLTRRNESQRGYGPTSGIKVVPVSLFSDMQYLAER